MENEGKAVHAALRACISWRARISSQAQVEALTKEYSDVITEAGGKIGKAEYWGLKTVAFKIKKNRKAHYSLMNLEAPPAASCRDGAAHGPVAGRHPLHHHPRR